MTHLCTHCTTMLKESDICLSWLDLLASFSWWHPWNNLKLVVCYGIHNWNSSVRKDLSVFYVGHARRNNWLKGAHTESLSFWKAHIRIAGKRSGQLFSLQMLIALLLLWKGAGTFSRVRRSRGQARWDTSARMTNKRCLRVVCAPYSVHAPT